MIIDLVTIAGKAYGIGNFRRMQNLGSSLNRLGYCVSLKVLSDVPKEYTQYDNVTTYSDCFASPEYYSNFITPSAEVVILDLYGEWIKNNYDFLVKIYKQILKKVPQIYTFDDVRYIEKIFNVKGINSFIVNAPDGYHELSTHNIRLYLGLKYHVFDEKVEAKSKKQNLNKEKKIVIALGGSASLKTIVKTCNSLSKIDKNYKVIVYINKKINKDIRFKLNTVLLDRLLSIENFSDNFYDCLAKAEYLICGEGTIKFDALKLGTKVIVLNLYDKFSLPLNNFSQFSSVEIIGSYNDLVGMKLEREILVAFDKLQKVSVGQVRSCSIPQIIEKNLKK